MSVHNHAPWRPVCNERRLPGGQLRGACLNDDGTPVNKPDGREVEAALVAHVSHLGWAGLGAWNADCLGCGWADHGETGGGVAAHAAFSAHLAAEIRTALAPWLAQRDAQQRAEALREAATAWDDQAPTEPRPGIVARWLRARADRIAPTTERTTR